jgi:hypothetical protein
MRDSKKYGGEALASVELGGSVGAFQVSGNLGLAVIPCQLRKMYILFVRRGITASWNFCLFLGTNLEDVSVLRHASLPRGGGERSV